MSLTTASNTKKFKKHCDWAFDFRTQYASSDDSQSGSESDKQELATSNIGASRPLIDDLDLSTREEHVAYKLNPFSIAKINAAYRPSSTVNASALQPVPPVRPADKPTQNRKPNKRSCLGSGQTTIMEGFKTQAIKKPRTNDLQLRPTTNQTLNSTQSVNKPAVEKPVVPVSPTKSTLSTATLLSTVADHTSPCFVSTTTVPNTSDFPSMSFPLHEYAHIAPPKASQPHGSQTLSKVSQSRTFAPVQLLPDMLRNQRKPIDNRRPVFSSFSSPGHRYVDGPLVHDPRALCSQTYSSPMQPVRQSPFRPYSTIAQPFQRKTTENVFVPHLIKPFGTKKPPLRGSSPLMFS